MKQFRNLITNLDFYMVSMVLPSSGTLLLQTSIISKENTAFKADYWCINVLILKENTSCFHSLLHSCINIIMHMVVISMLYYIQIPAIVLTVIHVQIKWIVAIVFDLERIYTDFQHKLRNFSEHTWKNVAEKKAELWILYYFIHWLFRQDILLLLE